MLRRPEAPSPPPYDRQQQPNAADKTRSSAALQRAEDIQGIIHNFSHFHLASWMSWNKINKHYKDI